ncbi:RluA family pseudouridine synthase [Rufibacter latericius]|uniref:RluA family pseudouridine synthase n=1 Tax=Rufibacter latericius TaxID=2487040 RepID=A0A3M9MKD0_9BACT|nr:RluA family pseudouridine synthase [Rufibacter latericius]RNI25939.1 RluA family pseudouridine synthase [Rufibacter latericius]
MPAPIKLDVLFEDNHILVVNKPSGVLVQGDETGDVPLSELAKEYIKQKYQKPGNVFMGVVHRLDRPVSGVVLLAKTSKALSRLNEQFKTRKTQKIYWAITQRTPQPESGTLVHWLIKDSERNTTKALTTEKPGSQRAELSYSLLKSMAGKNLVEVRPVTGRPHQIRVQLASLKCPILGDLRYGAPEPMSDKSICLHARELGFEHPVLKTWVTVQAPLPRLTAWQPFQP